MELGSAEAIEGVNSEIFSPLSPVAANEPAIGDKSIALDTTGAAERESGVFLARYDDLDMQICTIRWSDRHRRDGLIRGHDGLDPDGGKLMGWRTIGELTDEIDRFSALRR